MERHKRLSEFKKCINECYTQNTALHIFYTSLSEKYNEELFEHKEPRCEQVANLDCGLLDYDAV